MRVLFIQKDIFAKPAIMSLSAALEAAGHECDLLIHDLERNTAGKAVEADPDIIAFSVTTGEYPWMKAVGEGIRRRFGKSIICGGAHPTFYQDLINDGYLDAICIGEGEEAMVDFADTLQRGGDPSRVRNFIVRSNGGIRRNGPRPLVADLDSLPFFNRSIYRKYPIFRDSGNFLLYNNVVMTGRGCPYECSFCFNKIYNRIYRGKGEVYRRRSVEGVIKEISLMKEGDPRLKFITFDDDNFTLPPREWIFEFLAAYRKEIGIPFKINSRANLIDAELIEALGDAGCHAVKIGIESGNDDIRNRILKKCITREEIVSAASLIRRRGIKLQTYNVMGSPGETAETAMETFYLNREIRPDFVWCSLMNPYPGTEIYDYARSNGYLEDSFGVNSIGYSYFADTPIKMPDKRSIVNLQRLIYFAVFFRVPGALLRLLIRLPLSALYKLIFGIGLLVGLKRINKAGFFQIFRRHFFHLVRYNF